VTIQYSKGKIRQFRIIADDGTVGPWTLYRQIATVTDREGKTFLAVSMYWRGSGILPDLPYQVVPSGKNLKYEEGVLP
jgi:hypothetical protein